MITGTKAAQKRLTSPQFLDGSLGPICLALLAFAGPLKASPLLSWMPFDLTLTLALVTGLAAVASRMSRGPARGAILVPVGLLVLFLLGLVNNSIVGYSLSKTLALYTLTLLAMLAPFYLVRTPKQRRQFLGTFVVLACVVTAATVVSPGSVDEYTSIATLAGTNTISTGRMISTGVVIVLIFAIGSRTSMLNRALLFALGGALLLSTLNTGSRGPFLAIGAAVFGVLITAPMFRKYRKRALAAMLALAAIGLYFALREGGDGAARVFTLLNGEADNSVRVRTYLLSQAFEQISANPFGLGWGNFIDVPGLWRYTNGDRLYPHNVLVEVTLEAGWLAGIAVLAFVVSALIVAKRHAID
ncbi:MAG: O-antigen ligase family protein, partial [Mycetocola sp.]